MLSLYLLTVGESSNDVKRAIISNCFDKYCTSQLENTIPIDIKVKITKVNYLYMLFYLESLTQDTEAVGLLSYQNYLVILGFSCIGK